MTRTLILGGTGWLGKEIAEQLLAAGSEVTCLARGTAGRPPQDTTFLPADRKSPGAYDGVQGTEWDNVIELSYDSDLVKGAIEALAGSARHWTLISSVSVYADNDEPGAAEDAVLVEPTDRENYAHAKVAAERVTQAALGDRLLIARPGLIAGPGDPSDRFSYWVGRLALAAQDEVLVPDTKGRYVQIIDVRDLAAWLVDAGLRGLTGTYNAVGREREFSDVLQSARRVAGHTGELIPAGDSWLSENGVNYWAGPHSLPLWLPLADTAMAQRSGERFRAAGGHERSLTTTLEDVLADERQRGLHRPRRSGLSRAEEVLLLQKIRESAEHGARGSDRQ